MTHREILADRKRRLRPYRIATAARLTVEVMALALVFGVMFFLMTSLGTLLVWGAS